MVTIRPEKTEDYDTVFEINRLAFGREDEARLVETLRRADDFIPELSLVAAKDRQIVGHILFSPITIQTEGEYVPALSLAAVAVRPEFQRRGIGSALVRRGLDECLRLGHGIVILIGHPEYYPRFGFSLGPWHSDPHRTPGILSPLRIFSRKSEGIGNDIPRVGRSVHGARTRSRRVGGDRGRGYIPAGLRRSDISNGADGAICDV